MKQKKRLDLIIEDRFPSLSRTQIQSFIMQGKVTVEDSVITKPGILVDEQAHIHLTMPEQRYVSRAGYKLEKALDYFNIDVTGLVVLDAGLSTGGFADCLLQRGAQKIYGIDVGYGQVHEKIRQDLRVIVIERTNLRHVEKLPELVDLATLDLSFISVLKVIDVVQKLLKPDGKLLVLIKPQFEAEKKQVGRGGIITDSAVHQQVIETVKSGIEERGFVCRGIIESPITGTDGNKEFLAYFIKKVK